MPLEVVEAIDLGDRRGPHVYFVRDDDDAQFWCRVEYANRRLLCWCEDGMARQEDEYEPECRHLAAVLAWRALEQRTTHTTGAVVNASTFVD